MRIGIVNLENPPKVMLSCFQTFDNFSTLNFTNTEQCARYPGISVEIMFLIIQLLNISDYQFIPAETYGLAPSGKGLVDLVKKELVDFTVPQLVITPERKTLIAFSHPALMTNGPCFMTCGNDALVTVSAFGIINLFFSTHLIWAGLLGILWDLCYSLVREKFFHGLKYSHAIFSSLAEVSQFPESSHKSLSWRIFFVIFSFSALVLVQGFFEAALLDTFSPQKKFPFTSVKQMSEAILKNGWRLAFQSRGSHYYSDIENVAALEPLKNALASHPPSFEDNFEKIKMLIQNPKTIYMTDSIMQKEFLMNYRGQLNCICDPMDSATFEFVGLAFSTNNTEIQKLIDIKLITMKQFGILDGLSKKYRLANSKLLDSHKSNPLMKEIVQVQVQFKVILIPFVIYIAGILMGILVLVVERRASSIRNTRIHTNPDNFY